ncbi:MAG: histidinol-phosphate transaminase [Acidobacteriota bacterium]
MRKLVADNIASLTPYEPGKPVEEVMREHGLTHCVKLASNENPLGPSPLALDAITGHMKEVYRYPDSSGFHLKRKLARVYEVPESRMVLGNGSVEIIELVARTFLAPLEEAIVSEHAFVMFSLAIRAVNGRAVVVPSRKFAHDLDAMAAAVTERTKVVYIANPNNPTGTMATREELDRFFSRIPKDVIVVLDEAYCEYIKNPSYPNGLDDLREGKNVVVLRTFSKIYGLAGLRVGYAFAPEALVDAMERVRTPFNTTHLSQHAAIAALDDREHVERTYRVNNRERAFLAEELEKLQVPFVPSVTNFLLVDLCKPCEPVFAALLSRGVILRPLTGYGLPTHFRITVGTRPENEEMLRTLVALREEGTL